MKRTWSFIAGVLVGLVAMTIFGRGFLTQPSGVETTGLSLGTSLDELKTSIQEIGGANSETTYQKYDLIDGILEEEYYDYADVDKQAMYENALKGYVDAIGDPYTVYLSVDENELFDEEMEGGKNFEGIGAVVIKKEDGVLIEEVLKGFPAFIAGLRHLDLILEVDGVSVQGMTLTEAVNTIRGPKGTDVVLTIYRESDNTISEYTVTRDAVNVPSVRGELMDIDEKQILYLEIAIIGDDTLMTLRNVISEYRGTTEGVILDLRGNGGGYLPLAVDVASFFLPKNELVTTARYTNIADEVYRSKGFGDLEGLPVVILIDGLSASAAEIVAGSLDQRMDAVLIGTPTFGKGSIQTIRNITDGSSLKYTIGKWYLPDDTNVDEAGLVPDIELEFDVEAYVASDNTDDNQLEKAKEEIQKLFDE